MLRPAAKAQLCMHRIGVSKNEVLLGAVIIRISVYRGTYWAPYLSKLSHRKP